MYYCNIRGARSKYESLVNIINNQISPDIFAICETKLNNHSKLAHLFPDYNLLTRPNKLGKGGLLIALKKDVFPNVMDVTSSPDKNILVGRLPVSNHRAIRLILVYGLQENEVLEDREAFMLEVSIEIQKCIDSGDIPMVIGDLNAKVDLIDEKIVPLSSNGKLLLNVVNEHNLHVINFTEKCDGKWTHVIRTTDERSVLDYLIASEVILESINEMVIDEDCLMCPFVSGQKRVTYSDHNAILFSAKIDVPKPSKPPPDFRWKIDEEGLQKIKELTTIDACPRKDLTGNVQHDYDMLEAKISSVLSKSCKKLRKKNKCSQVSGKYIRCISQLSKYGRKGKIQRNVVKKYKEMILDLNAEEVGKMRRERLRKAIEALTVNGEFSSVSVDGKCLVMPCG